MRQLLILALSGLVIGLLLFLLVQTQAIDVDRHNARLAHLRMLEQLDSELNEEIAKARLYLDVESEALPKLVARLREEREALSKGATSMVGLNTPVEAALGIYLAALRDKLKLAEDYELQNLQLINALEVIPAASGNVLGILAEPQYASLRNLVISLRSEIMTYGVLPSPTNTKLIEDLTYELDTRSVEAPDDYRTDVLQLSSLSNSVLSTKAMVQDMVGKLLSAPTETGLARLQEAYAGYHQTELTRANRYRIALIAYASALLLVLAFLGLRLRSSYHELDRVNDELKATNENLEGLVQARTADLKQAYDHLREQQAQLIQSEKMASLGQMVAGVAHEINTPLAYARGNVQTVGEVIQDVQHLLGAYDQAFEVLKNPGANESDVNRSFGEVEQRKVRVNPQTAIGELKQLLNDSDYGLEQISDLVLNLKDFSRLDRSRAEHFNVNEGLNSALKICQNMLKDRIDVVRNYGVLPQIECAPSQLNQVFLNIITNASQAINGQGRIELTTLANASGVAVKIRDNGHGMDEKTKAKIFEPFFTTKDVGKGTGLGLSISFRIIKDHGGRIEVTSAPGKGSEFVIHLPKAQAKTQAAGTAAKARATA